MFDQEFFPTSSELLQDVISYFGCNLSGKVVYDPQGGKGNIVDFAINEGASDVISCELHPDLRAILKTKCTVIGRDSSSITSDQISHVDVILMNPPFSNADEHILHAWDTAPAGCVIISLCNSRTYDNPHTKTRKRLVEIVETYGDVNDFGSAFMGAERKTNVKIYGLYLVKPGGEQKNEFDGFYLEDDPEEEQANSIVSYNVVRDLVNRYVSAVKLYDEQLTVGAKMKSLIGSFYHDRNDKEGQLSFQCTENGAPKMRNEFKKDLQRSAWLYIFDKMDMARHTTKGLREDINKFVSQQMHVPFTMRNVYRMLQIVSGTTTQRMDKALEEVFDKLTAHHHDNRYNVEGWKTNSHFLVNKKFIINNMCYQDQRWHKGESKIQISAYGNSFELMEDFVKALCYITGDDYSRIRSLDEWIRHPYKVITKDKIYMCHTYDGKYDKNDPYHKKDSVLGVKEDLYREGIASEMIHDEPAYGQWFEWAYFRCKAFKKGSMHFEFKDPELWARFNARVAKIKGFVLFEGKEQTNFQKRNTGRPVKKKQKQAA
jgi:hypothetical protein